MKPKIKFFICADYISVDQLSNKLSINGIFDTFTSVLYPTVMPKSFIALGINNFENTIDLEVNIISPNDELVVKYEVRLTTQNINNTANWIIALDGLHLPQKGKYIVNVINKFDNSVINEYFVMADYLQPRIFSQEEIEGILKDPTLMKGAKVKILCPYCQKEYNLELNLNKEYKTEEGWLQFPENDLLECCEGRTIELTGIRRQIEYEYGKKLKKDKTNSLAQ